MKIVDKNNMSSIIKRIKGKFVKKETGKGLSTNDFSDADQSKLASLGWYVDISRAMYDYYNTLEEAISALPECVSDPEAVTLISFSGEGNEDIHFFKKRTRTLFYDDLPNWEEVTRRALNFQIQGIPTVGGTYTSAQLASEFGITKTVWNNLKNLSYNYLFIEDSGMVMSFDYGFLALPTLECLTLQSYKVDIPGLSSGEILNIYTEDDGVTYKCVSVQ